MKKVLLPSLVVILAGLLMTGCANSATPVTTAMPSATAVPIAISTTPDVQATSTAIAEIMVATGVARVTATADARAASGVPGYFGLRSGKLIYKDDTEQTFSGLRCFYSGMLYYSRSLDSVSSKDYQSAPSLDLDQLERIDFTDRPNQAIRRGTAKFRDGTVLENQYFRVGECSWWERPGLEGKLSDPAIAALVITQVIQE